MGRDRGPAWGPPLMASMASQGEAILQKLQQLLGRSVSLMVATNSPSLARNSTDLQVLAAHGRCFLHPGPGPCLAGTMGQGQRAAELLAGWGRPQGWALGGEAQGSEQAPVGVTRTQAGAQGPEGHIPQGLLLSPVGEAEASAPARLQVAGSRRLSHGKCSEAGLPRGPGPAVPPFPHH